MRARPLRLRLSPTGNVTEASRPKCTRDYCERAGDAANRKSRLPLTSLPIPISFQLLLSARDKHARAPFRILRHDQIEIPRSRDDKCPGTFRTRRISFAVQPSKFTSSLSSAPVDKKYKVHFLSNFCLFQLNKKFSSCLSIVFTFQNIFIEDIFVYEHISLCYI